MEREKRDSQTLTNTPCPKSINDQKLDLSTPVISYPPICPLFPWLLPSSPERFVYRRQFVDLLEELQLFLLGQPGGVEERHAEEPRIRVYTHEEEPLLAIKVGPGKVDAEKGLGELLRHTKPGEGRKI